MVVAKIRRVRRASLFAAISVALALPVSALPPPAGDQAQTAGAKAQDAMQLEAVVVTSQKREQKLQEVPIAITALDGSQIEAQNVESARDLDGLVPGLSVTPDPAYGQGAQFYIRGMGKGSLSISRSSPVSVYLDGVYVGGNMGNILDLVNLSRVEVLRGPQGTLYGRNSMAGAINLISAEPSGDFNGYASLNASNYNGLQQKLHVDLPKMGIASFSISARSNERDGWIESTDRNMKSDVSDVNERGVRVAGLFEFSPNFKALYTFDKSNAHTNGLLMQVVSVDDAYFNQFGFKNVSQFGSKDRLTKANLDGSQFWRQETGGHSLTMTWQVNDTNTLKSISAYRAFDMFANPDEDGTPYPIVVVADPIPAGLKAWSGYNQNAPAMEYHQWSQELQWVGSVDKLNYVAGLYYYASGGRAGGTSSYYGLTHTFSAYELKDSSFAAYGQLDYQPVDPLTLSVGLRKNFDKAVLVDRVYGCRQSSAACTPAPGEAFKYVIPPGTNGSAKFDALSPAYAANWKINDQVNVYARYAHGFLAGGFNTSIGSSSKSTADNIRMLLTPFKPEKSKSFEVGTKASALDNRLQGSLSLFNTRYTDLQQSVFVAENNNAVLVRNAGKATIRGAELEAAFVVVPGTTVRAHYAWLDPKYNEFIEDDRKTGKPYNYANNRAFAHAPRNSYGASIDSRLARFDWGTVRLHADYHYTGSAYTSSNQLKGSGPEYEPTSAIAGNSVIKGYGLLNAQLMLTNMPLSSTMTGELSLWCRNCTNKAVPNNVLDFGPGFGNLVLATFTTPVTYGLQGTVRW